MIVQITNDFKERYQLLPSPNHGNGSSQTSTHVEGQITFRAFDLSLARLPGQLLIGFDDLAHAGCSNRMTITNQSATGIDRSFPADFTFDVLTPNLRKRGRSALCQLGAFALLSQTENL